MWKGFVSIGLLNVPVKMITMREDKKISAHMYRAADLSPIKMPKVAEKDGAVVPYNEIVFGYEIDGGKEIVILSKAEKEAAKVESDHKIAVEGFVPVEEIDQMYFDGAYILIPDGMPGAYSLLLEAFKVRGKAGIGKITVREKEYIAIVHAYEGGLVLSTLKYQDEVVMPREVDDLKALPVANPNELNLAVSIIDALAARFDLTKYHDGAREKLLSIIEAKRHGEVIVAEPVQVEKPAALMDALKAVLAEVEKQKVEHPLAPQGEIPAR